MFNSILVPLDGSALSEGALPTAVALARQAQSHVTLVRAVWPGRAARGGLLEAQYDALLEAQTYLEGAARHVADQGVPVEVRAPSAPPAKAILAETALQGADLVVMTTHGRTGVGRWLFGSVAEAVLANTSAPVWLIRAWGTSVPGLFEQPTPRILVPLDGSPFGEAALGPAAQLARLVGGTLVLLHVLAPIYLPVDPLLAQAALESVVIADERDARAYLETCQAALRGEGLAVDVVTETGDPAETILAVARRLDVGVVAMATHGWTGLERLIFGSVALEVLRRGRLPLLLARPTHGARPVAIGQAALVSSGG